MVALSGGVDSAVSLLRLRDRGADVEAIFMKNWEEDDETGYCAAAEDLADATAVCRRLGVALRTVNFSAEYWERVFERFLDGLRLGLTPNPDVACNREVKFQELLEHAQSLGAAQVATGHYARIVEHENRLRLYKGADPGKDQSYFLYTLGQEALQRCQFPIGELTKTEVRRIAQEAGLAVHAKRDSTGICFIGERPFSEFLARYIPETPGPVVTPEGTRLGTHRGLAFYTVGQRRGLGIGGRRAAGDAPWYVARKELENNHLIVVQGHSHPLLFSRALRATELSWVAGEPARLPARLGAKIRYRQAEQSCHARLLSADTLRLDFEQPQWAVTPGQSVVLYRGEECLGGGIIQQAVA